MAIENKKFGIELELVGIIPAKAAETLRRAGFLCDFEGYNHRDHADAWKVVTDSSLVPNQSGQGACEVVSPILKGEAGIASAVKAAKALTKAGATANKSCGFHVHFDASTMSVETFKMIITRYAKFESEIDAFMPASRRANENTYCKSLNALSIELLTACDSVERVAESQRRFYNRYFKINATAYLRHHTIEFRHHSGTCDAEKVYCWVNFLSDFIDECERRAHATPVSESAQTFTGRTQTLVEFLSNGGKTYDEIAERFGIKRASARTLIVEAKQRGANITRNGALIEFRAVQTTTATPEADSLWSGIRSQFKGFYEIRRVMLAA